VIVGLVLATHVITLHVHREHLADLLYPIGVVDAADKPRAVERLVSRGIGEDVENRIDGRRNGSFDSDLVVAHTSTLPKLAL
jgi:hypothetical protein